MHKTKESYDWLDLNANKAYCSRCNKWKDLSEFPKLESTQNNYRNFGKKYHKVYCKECNMLRAREWRKQHPGYRGSGLFKNEPEAEKPWLSAVRAKVRDAKARAEKYNKDFNIDAKYAYNLLIKQNKKCAITYYPLSLEKNHPFNLSIDCIEPEKGYIKGNIQWLLWCVNRAKGDLNMATFYDLCELVLKHRKSND